MDFMRGLDVSATGLTAQRIRMDIISSNLANVHTTRTSGGGPYRRKDVVFKEESGGSPETLSFKSILNSLKGVVVDAVKEDTGPFKKVYDPGHPDADTKGYVSFPNVNTVEEMVNMLSATRSYEANITAVESYKSMFMKALDILR